MRGKRFLLSLIVASAGEVFSAEGDVLPDTNSAMRGMSAAEVFPGSVRDSAPAAPAAENPVAASTVPAESSPAKPREEPGVPVPAPNATSAADRMAYVVGETIFSTYTYGLAFPLAWGEIENWKISVGATAIAAPITFFTHFWISRRLEFKESHRKGTLQLSMLSLYAATALPIAFSDDWRKGYRTGTLLGALVYPFGTWYGYHLGEVHRQQPSRLDTKFGYAFMYGLFGAGIPLLFSDELDSLEAFRDIPSKTLRWGLGQSVAFAAVGHFLGDFAPTSKSPEGVRIGIGTHAVLGGLTGLEIAVLSDVKTLRPWIGSAMLGVMGGVTEGVFFFYNKRDNRERGLFSLLGAAGGGLMGAGMQLLFDSGKSDHGKIVAWSSSVMIGSWLGYGLSYLLTTGMVEPVKGASAGGDGERASTSWTFNPFPSLEPTLSRGDLSMRWNVPGLSYRF